MSKILSAFRKPAIEISPVSLALIRMLFALAFLLMLVSEMTIYAAGFGGLQLIASSILILLSLCVFFGYYSKIAVFVMGVVCILIYWHINHHWSGLGVTIVASVGPGGKREHIFLGYMALLLAFTPCGQVMSLDAVLGKSRRGESLVESRAAFVMQALLISIYFWAAISKLTPDFLSGFVFQSMVIRYVTGSYLFTYSEQLNDLFVVVAKVAIAVEFALAAGLAFKKTRAYAVYMGVLMHLMLIFVTPLMVFSIAVIAVYLLFIDQAKLHRFTQKFFAIA